VDQSGVGTKQSRCTHWFALVRALLFCTAFMKTRKLPVYRQYTGSCRGRGAHSHPLPATSSLGAATPPVRTLRRRDNKNIFKKCLDFAWTLLTRAAAAGVPKLLLDGLAAQKRCDSKSDFWLARKRALARHAPTTVAAAVVAALVCGGLADGAVGVQNRLAVALVGRVELKARLVRGQLDWGLGLAAPPHTTDMGICSAGRNWL
jgi:hypothetical protein